MAQGKNTIWVGAVDNPANDKPSYEEGVCTEASVLPGSVLDYAASSAGFELMDDAATVYGKPLLVADKDSVKAKSVSEAWIINENMNAIRPKQNDRLNVLVITGQALVRGTPLTRSATPGALTIATPATEEVLCYADEIVTTSATQLVRVRSA